MVNCSPSPRLIRRRSSTFAVSASSACWRVDRITSHTIWRWRRASSTTSIWPNPLTSESLSGVGAQQSCGPPAIDPNQGYPVRKGVEAGRMTGARSADFPLTTLRTAVPAVGKAIPTDGVEQCRVRRTKGDTSHGH